MHQLKQNRLKDGSLYLTTNTDVLKTYSKQLKYNPTKRLLLAMNMCTVTHPRFHLSLDLS